MTKYIKYVAVLLVVLFGIVFFYNQQMVEKPAEYVDSATTSDTEIAAVEVDTTPLNLDMTKALKPRILGDASAPIKIAEHSSFTCSHCGKFHKTTFDQFKAEYIDTGKAYLVFSDFPLNAPALHASMVGRCLAEDQYFEYVEHLFNQQEHWAYDSNYLEFLKKEALEHGLSEDNFRACLKNEALREGILTTMKAVQSQWEVRSTPSFVVNNKTVLSGAMIYDDFVKKIEAAVGGTSANNVENKSEAKPIETLDYPTPTPAPVVEESVEEPAEKSEVTPTAEEDNTEEKEVEPTALEELQSDIKALSDDVGSTAAKVGEAVKNTAEEVKETAQDVIEDAVDETEESADTVMPELTPLPTVEVESPPAETPNGQ